MPDKPVLHGRDHSPGGADQLKSWGANEDDVLQADGEGGIRWGEIDVPSLSSALVFETAKSAGDVEGYTTLDSATLYRVDGAHLNDTYQVSSFSLFPASRPYYLCVSRAKSTIWKVDCALYAPFPTTTDPKWWSVGAVINWYRSVDSTWLTPTFFGGSEPTLSSPAFLVAPAFANEMVSFPDGDTGPLQTHTHMYYRDGVELDATSAYDYIAFGLVVAQLAQSGGALQIDWKARIAVSAMNVE